MATPSVIPPTYTPVSQTPGMETAQQQPQQPQQQPQVETAPGHSFSGESPQQFQQPSLPVPDFGQANERGSFYFSHLSFTGTLARTFTLFFEHWRVFIPIAAAAVVPFAIFVVSSTIWIVGVIIKEEHDYTYHPKHIHLIYFLMFLQLIMYGVITVWARGAMIRAVSEIYAGKIPTGSMWSDCLRHVWGMGHVRPLIISSVLVYAGLGMVGLVPYVLLVISEWAQNGFLALISLCGILVFLVFAMYVYSLCILASPVICIENNLRPIPALIRSREIVTGTHCYVYLCLLVLYIINHIATAIAHSIFVGHDGTAGRATMLAVTSFEGLLTNMVPLLIFFPLHTILEAVMYVNIRVQRESLDRDTFVRELEEQDRLPTMDIASRYNTGTTLNMDGMWKSVIGNAGGLMSPGPSTDYRQVPLMDGEPSYSPQGGNPPQQQFV